VTVGTLREEKAIRLAIVTSVLGAGVKLGVGLSTGSMAMVSSAADSIGDIIISVANLFVVRLSDEEPDEEHNYGHAKIEGLGAMFEGGFIGAAGGFVLYSAIAALVEGRHAPPSDLAILTMLPVLAMTLGTVGYMRKVARETGSLVVKADAVHYESDVWMNLGVLVSLVAVKLTGRPELDAIVSVGIAAWMLRASVQVVREGFDVVMDRSLPAEQVTALRAMVAAAPGVRSFHDFRTRGGKVPHVDVHVVVHPAMTAQALHDLHLHVLAEARRIVGPSTRVLLHADPEGDEDHAGDDIGGVDV